MKKNKYEITDKDFKIVGEGPIQIGQAIGQSRVEQKTFGVKERLKFLFKAILEKMGINFLQDLLDVINELRPLEYMGDSLLTLNRDVNGNIVIKESNPGNSTRTLYADKEIINKIKKEEGKHNENINKSKRK